MEQKYGTPVCYDNKYDAEDLVQILSDLQSTVNNEQLDQDLENIKTLLHARDTHDVEDIYQIGHIVHDLDYYLFRYGPEMINSLAEEERKPYLTYYGVLCVYEDTPYTEEVEFSD